MSVARIGHGVFLLLWAVVLVARSQEALGQIMAVGAADGPGHAWASFPAPLEGAEGDGASAVYPGVTQVHAPPRVAAGPAEAAPAGRLARAVRIAERPEWLAASGSRLYCVMPADEGGVRSVGALRAEPRGYQDLWAYLPGGRLRVLPALEGAGDVLGAAAIGDRLYVLGSGGAGLVLRWTEGSSWASSASLLDPQGHSPSLHLTTDDTGLAAVEVAGDGIWLHRWDAERGLWSASRLRSGPSASFASARLVGVWRGEAVFAERVSDGWAISTVSPGGVSAIAKIEAPVDAGLAVVERTGRVLAVWDSERETDDVGSGLATPGVSARVQRVAEVSLVTGLTIFDGLATTTAPISRSEFRRLALLLFVLMIVVLMVALRPVSAGGVVTLPPGTALASSGRRVLATVIDFVPSVMVTSLVLGVPPVEVLGPLTLPLTGSLAVTPLLVALSLSVLHCTVGEAVFGRSVGKAMAGLFVARVDQGVGSGLEPGRFSPPTPGGALVRNLIKWFVAPAAALALSDPSGRHRGDLAAGVAVLMPVVDPG